MTNYFAEIKELEAEVKKAEERVWWLRRKIDGRRVEALLADLAVGAEFRLANVGRAYTATYRKNEAGRFDQISAVETPLVTNFDADHLGFCVGYAAVVDALDFPTEQV